MCLWWGWRRSLDEDGPLSASRALFYTSREGGRAIPEAHQIPPRSGGWATRGRDSTLPSSAALAGGSLYGQQLMSCSAQYTAVTRRAQRRERSRGDFARASAQPSDPPSYVLHYCIQSNPIVSSPLYGSYRASSPASGYAELAWPDDIGNIARRRVRVASRCQFNSPLPNV